MGSSEGIPLRRYSKPAIDRAAATLRQRAEDGLFSQLDLAQGMAAFVLRDEKGGYWFLDANSDQWFHFAQGDWQPAQTIPQGFEGMDGLVSASDVSPATEPEARHSQGTTPIQALTDAVTAVRNAYTQGQIDDLSAEALLARRVLIDREGQAWTIGFQSNQWYVFGQEAWEKQRHGPAVESLLYLHAPAACASCGQTVRQSVTCPRCGASLAPEWDGATDEARAQIARLLLLGADTLPEAVTAPWMPPLGLPNVQVPQVTRTVPLQVPPAPAEATAPEAWTLRWIDGPMAGQQEEISSRVRIGRETDNDIELRLASVSRHHAVLEWTGTTYQITDLGSANGTYVNGTRIAQPTLLQSGDTVTLQEASFTLNAPEMLTCPSCGQALRPGTRFCVQCGTRAS